jgi:hypothetical protein
LVTVGAAVVKVGCRWYFGTVETVRLGAAAAVATAVVRIAVVVIVVADTVRIATVGDRFCCRVGRDRAGTLLLDIIKVDVVDSFPIRRTEQRPV